MANIKSAISFGLVHIPVTLNPIVKDNNVSFNFIHKKCGNRVRYVKMCPHCKAEVKKEDLVKGYEYTKNKYVIFEDEDFEKLKSDGDRTLEIIAFVNLDEIDPIYYSKSYYLMAPDKTRAFSLFRSALKKTNKVAIAKTVLGNKEHYVTLRFGQNNIIMNTLFYLEEIRLNEEVIEEKFSQEELKMAIKLIESMSDKFIPENYNDVYQQRIQDSIKRKIKGQDIEQVKEKSKKSISDLMMALEKSVKKKKAA